MVQFEESVRGISSDRIMAGTTSAEHHRTYRIDTFCVQRAMRQGSHFSAMSLMALALDDSTRLSLITFSETSLDRTLPGAFADVPNVLKSIPSTNRLDESVIAQKCIANSLCRKAAVAVAT